MDPLKGISHDNTVTVIRLVHTEKSKIIFAKMLTKVYLVTYMLILLEYERPVHGELGDVQTKDQM
jgi:hypothetical protein